MSQVFPNDPMQPNMGPPPSSGGRSVLWIVLAVLGVSALLCCGVCGVGSFYFGRFAIDAATGLISAQAQAESAIRSSQEVKDRV